MIHKSTTNKDDRDLWSTPSEIFALAQELFGEFDVDLAANNSNTKCVDFIGKAENSLAAQWNFFGDRGWLNPPYSDISLWFDKAIGERDKYKFSTVILAPTPNGESYFEKVLKEVNSITYIIGRISFISVNGQRVNGNPRGSCFYYFSGRGPRGPAMSCVKRPLFYREKKVC